MLFSGEVLQSMKLERPFTPNDGELRVITNTQLTPTFGTGIHTVTPAHNIESLRLSYAFRLSREGCVDSKNGTLTQPAALEGTNIHEKNIVNKLGSALQEHDQFFTNFKH